MTVCALRPSQPTLRELSNAQIAFRDPGYLRHNSRRLEHLASIGLDLTNKSVLELGAGIGDHTTFFLDRGCSVTSVEPRAENCALFKQFIGNRAELIQSDIKSLKLDEKFDIIYAYGLLYHLEKPEKALESMARLTNELLLIETRVGTSDEERVLEDTVDPTNSFHGRATRLTRQQIFSCLQENMEFAYIPFTQPFHEEFPVDWNRASGISRAVFVGSRQRLTLPLLVDSLVERQIRG